ncbi:hypothetical protein [Acinetobacter sp. WCHAc010052]|jgi:hypothetical protein|uniref:hypothetical protein n=1 Tax=Acinetobacter sp. WCHAc010052 TaxID=2004647 RepID=UPI000B3C78FA|nr:hypothetical protein [Acinetobacter sp. WCHAc010052]AXY59009.1 hypothetical protein CDG61_02495 [Acinetobacter sp. WCHAc010052]
MKKLMIAMMLGVLCTVPVAYAEDKIEKFTTLKEAHAYLTERKNHLELLGEINSDKAYIHDWKSDGCVTSYFQSGKGVSYGGHELRLRQEVVIDWSKVSELRDLFTSRYRMFLVGGVSYQEYTLLVRGWQARDSGTAVAFRPEDMSENDIKRTFNAMEFIHQQCKKR